MKLKFPLFFLCCFVLISLTTNSCKKNQQDYIQTLITQGKWELASVVVTHYTGAATNSMDTLNTTCDSTQIFKFNTDKTCSYTNFDCLPQSVNGHWSLSADQLFLYADMVCQDTSAAKSSKPFQTAKIINLGQYSLVLQTGNLETYYTPTQVRTITQYGFVRVKSK
ncbi:MAG: hypothetical protein JWP78_2490 [Mucilaginibacter sp.]|nr:hypothetical protein [Mucilaginibacter sp.]